MSYYDVLNVILHDLSLIDNYEQLTGISRPISGLLRVYYGKLRFIEAFYVLVTTCLRIVTISYEVVTNPGKKYKKILQISLYHHSTTDVYCETIWHMRERHCSYIRISTTAPSTS